MIGMPGVTAPAPQMPGVVPARQEFSLGLPVPTPAPAPLPPMDIETLLRAAFAAGNRMIVIVKDERGRFQTSMKRPDGIAFAVEIHADLAISIRGALNPLVL